MHQLSYFSPARWQRFIRQAKPKPKPKKRSRFVQLQIVEHQLPLEGLS
jgi:hypothetical protein